MRGWVVRDEFVETSVLTAIRAAANQTSNVLTGTSRRSAAHRLSRRVRRGARRDPVFRGHFAHARIPSTSYVRARRTPAPPPGL